MTTGLVLVKLIPGKEKQALAKIRSINGVRGASGTFGPWDAVATVAGRDLETLAQLVVGKIRAVRGVENTETLIEVKI
jgi:DNA-binding Lrp family transcriptional regulator